MPARRSIFRGFHFQATVQLGRWSVKLGRWRTTVKRRHMADGAAFEPEPARMEAARLPSRGSRLHVRLSPR